MKIEDQVLALLMVVPLMTAPIAAILRPARLAWLAACAASAAMFALAIGVCDYVLDGGVIHYQVGGWAPPEGIELVVGPVSAIVLLIITGSSTVALFAGGPSIRQQIALERRPYFFAAWLLALAGLTGITITGDAFNVFVFMEVSSLASYVLVASGTDRRCLTATFQYLTMGTIGATFYLTGIGLLYMMTGTLNLADMSARMGEVENNRLVFAATGFITIGLGLKAGMFPLHGWMPEAYTRAPHAATTFLAACSTKVAILVLLQFDFLIFQGNFAGHAARFTTFLAPLAVGGMLFGSAAALVQSDVKRLLAWSSVGQIGYILLGAGLANSSGVAAAVSHMFAHGIAKATTFLALAFVALRIGTTQLDGVAGSYRRMPWTWACLFVGGLSLIGMPGTAGFVSKWLLITAALDSGPFGPLLVVAILLSSLLSVAYVWKIVEAVGFGGRVNDIATPQRSEEAPLPLLLVLLACTGTNIWFGFVTDIPVDLSTRAAEVLMEASRAGR
jgi:multicomponent Na+:H+ antiporter subunit D